MTTFEPLREQLPRRVGPPPPKRLIGPRTAAVDRTNGIKQSGKFAYVVRRDASGRLRLAPAWPLWALLVAFPLWWALGVSTFIFAVLAIPMARTLIRRRHTLQLPRGWWLWALFLVWLFLSLVMFKLNPPGTHPGTTGGRALSIAVDMSNYFAATVAMLFVANLTDRELPVARVMRWLSALFIVVVAGGLLGTLDPHFQFSSPLELILPGSVRSIPYVHTLVHPAAAQVQAVFGSGETGRAAAPFGYTNTWGNVLSLVLIWFVATWGLSKSPRRRFACFVILAVAAVPIVYSLNRGLWIGIAVSVLWVAVRLFLQGKVGALIAVIAATAVGAFVFAATPLQSIFVERLAHQNSNNIRSYLSAQAVSGALESPILGWGGTRKTIGSALSVAIGKTPQCQLCGDFSIGGNGQLWGVLFNQGIVGACFYFGFFALTIWLYRRHRSPPAQAAVLVIALTFVFMFVYNALPAPLALTMISVGILRRLSGERTRPAHAAGREPARAKAAADRQPAGAEAS